MDEFEIVNGKVIFNGLEYDFDKLPENIVFDGDIDLYDKKLLTLPNMSSWTIKGNFACSHNNITSFEGCPAIIGGGFWCINNYLTSLEHCPEKINGDFACYDNSLTSLKHCPKEVYGNFYCMGNSIEIIDAWPEYIDGKFIIYDNPIKSIKEGILSLRYLIEFYKKHVGNSKELLMKEFGCNTKKEINSYLLMMGGI